MGGEYPKKSIDRSIFSPPQSNFSSIEHSVSPRVKKATIP